MSFCHCEIPRTDSDLGMEGTEDDWCWACKSPIDPEGYRV